MHLQKATIRDLSKKVSLRRCPWDPLADYDIVKELLPGDKITVSTDHIVYDWTDNSYCEVYDGRQLIGFIRLDAIDIG